MNGMWLIIFWIALICSVHSRPQNIKFDDSSPNVELTPLLFGGIIPSWNSRAHLQPIFNQNYFLYRLIPLEKNGGGSNYDLSVAKKAQSITTEPSANLKDSSTVITKDELNLKKNEKISQNTEKIPVTPMNPINRMIFDLTKDSIDLMGSKQQENSLAPYRHHPLLNFLRQRINLGDKKIIEVRNDRPGIPSATTTLILKPVARSVAGVDGKAIATPISRAALRKGVNADILFEPDAIAIAGPGGVAHAESNLEIYYEDDREEKR